jgi:hypothetical protein
MAALTAALLLPGFASADERDDKMSALCESGNSTACYEAGEKFRTVERDLKTALTFFKKSCEKGHIDGCNSAGALVQNTGQPNSEEWKEAAKMFEKACEQKHDKACFNLGLLKYREGRSKKAVEYFKIACDLDKTNRAACDNLKRLSD